MMNSKYIEYSYSNSRGIIAIPNRNDFNTVTIDNDIVELNLNNDPLIELGDVVVFDKNDNKCKYICNKIIDLGDRSFLIQESNGNLCNKFIAPLIIGDMPILNFENLYNCYINKCLDRFYIVFKFSNDDSYTKLEEQLSKNNNFITVTDYKSGFVVFEFESVSIKYVLKSFMNGKYSEFPPSIKDKIIKVANNIHIKEVLLKKQTRRKKLEERLGIKLNTDAELMSKPTETEYYEYFETNILNKYEC